MSKVIFSSRKHSRKIKDLLPHLKVWARILLGCVIPRPITKSCDYIDGDQPYMLYYIQYGKKVNFLALLFQNLRDIVRDAINGSKRTKSYIPLSRMISDIMMENKLIDSLIDDQFTEGTEPTSIKWLNGNGLKNMKIITEVISPLAEVSKEEIHNIRIYVNDFPIFSKPYSLEDVVKIMEKCHVDVLLAASKVISQKNNRKISKKHSERMANKFKAFREHQENFVEAPRASKATSTGTYVPSDNRLITNVNSSSIHPSLSLHPSQPYFHTPFHLFWN